MPALPKPANELMGIPGGGGGGGGGIDDVGVV